MPRVAPFSADCARRKAVGQRRRLAAARPHDPCADLIDLWYGDSKRPAGRIEGTRIIMRAFRAITAGLCGLCLFAANVCASAQTWPTAGPITIVAPVPPGPSVDMIARLVAPKLSEALSQT